MPFDLYVSPSRKSTTFATGKRIILDVKNTVRELLPNQCRDIDAPMIAIYRARYHTGSVGNGGGSGGGGRRGGASADRSGDAGKEVKVEKTGPPLEPWISVDDVVEEMFSDAAMGWTVPESQHGPEAREKGKGKRKGEGKGKGKDVLQLTDLKYWDEDEHGEDDLCGFETDEAEHAQALERERMQRGMRNRSWQRSKQKVVFVVEIPEAMARAPGGGGRRGRRGSKTGKDQKTGDGNGDRGGKGSNNFV